MDAADIGRTTFYARVETKDFLLKELLDHIIDTAMGCLAVSITICAVT